jgi:hypothetical protein
MLSSHLRLGRPRGLYLSGFLVKILYTFIVPSMRDACPALIVLPDLIVLIIFGEEHKVYGLLQELQCSY